MRCRAGLAISRRADPRIVDLVPRAGRVRMRNGTDGKRYGSVEPSAHAGGDCFGAYDRTVRLCAACTETFGTE